MKSITSIILTGSILFLAACSPKPPKPTVTDAPQPQAPAPEIIAGKCPTFKDAPNPDLALENFVLYRDFLRAGDWKAAFEKWQQVYKVSPAADGKRSTVFTDGIKFYEHFITQDSSKKQEYMNKIFELWDAMEHCYPEGGYVTGMKAFEYFYKFPELKTKLELYQMFKKSIDQDKGEPRFFVLNPFTALLVDLALEEKIPVEEAKKYQKIISSTIEKGLANCKGEECEPWKVINEYAPLRLEGLEAIEGFYDYTYYKKKYYPQFEANPKDCEVIMSTYSHLKWGKTPDNDPQLMAINDAYNKNCVKESGPGCNDLLRNGKYRDAISCLEEQIPKLSDNAAKAQYNLLIAKIYYAYLKNYPRSRQYALAAARLKSNWGEPYLLIGTLYASSGPLCGPGRGWDSQVVVWPAIDMWQRARSIDSGVASEASRLINQYSQYMPSLDDIFQRMKSEGDSYYVGCWIQESTVIRAAK
jgi:hypothetical protein